MPPHIMKLTVFGSRSSPLPVCESVRVWTYPRIPAYIANIPANKNVWK